MPRLPATIFTSLLLCSSCAPCMGVDVETARDGTTSRRVSSYLSSPVELTIVDDGGALLLDARYTVDGDGEPTATSKAVAEVRFANGHVETLTAIAPPYASTGALATTFRARFPVSTSFAQHLTTTPILLMRLGTPKRSWTFEAKAKWAGELVTRSRCVIPPAVCQPSPTTIAAR